MYPKPLVSDECMDEDRDILPMTDAIANKSIIQRNVNKFNHMITDIKDKVMPSEQPKEEVKEEKTYYLVMHVINNVLETQIYKNLDDVPYGTMFIVVGKNVTIKERNLVNKAILSISKFK